MSHFKNLNGSTLLIILICSCECINIKCMHVSATQLFLRKKRIGELDAEKFFKFNLLIIFGYMFVIYFQIPNEQSNILINFY